MSRYIRHMPDSLPDESLPSVEWTFRRKAERVVVRREDHGEGDVWLSVTDRLKERCYSFASLEQLQTFQSNMEAFLVRTGWVLEAFAPERRSGRDRRRMPRIDDERRRWWTDAWPE
jgi:hypothetical protein